MNLEALSVSFVGLCKKLKYTLLEMTDRLAVYLGH